jgi:predicted nucleic acid-binding protein
MDKNGWNVSEAKQQFSEVLRCSESEPQLIYRRDRLIAAVISVDETRTTSMLIAATADIHGLTLVTRNVRDFEQCHIDLLNPFA